MGGAEAEEGAMEMSNIHRAPSGSTHYSCDRTLMMVDACSTPDGFFQIYRSTSGDEICAAEGRSASPNRQETKGDLGKILHERSVRKAQGQHPGRRGIRSSPGVSTAESNVRLGGNNVTLDL